MTTEEIAKHCMKRIYGKNSVNLNYEASRKRTHTYWEPNKNLTAKDVDVVNLIAGMGHEERNELQENVSELQTDRWRRNSEANRRAYKKKQESMESRGEDFKSVMEVGDVVEVKKNYGNGKMYVLEMSGDTFTGKYVFQKMDMPFDQFKKTGQVTEKMYKFVIRIVCKQAKILS